MLLYLLRTQTARSASGCRGWLLCLALAAPSLWAATSPAPPAPAPASTAPAAADANAAGAADGSGAAAESRVAPQPRQELLDALAAQVPVAEQVFLPGAPAPSAPPPPANNPSAAAAPVPSAQPAPAQEHKFLALYRPNSAEQVMGAVLLVHDAGQHADWPQVIHPLRTGLNDYGWHTLSINLPALPDAELPARVFADKGHLFEASADQAQPSAPATSSAAAPATASLPADKGTIQLDKQDVTAVDSLQTYEKVALQRIASGMEYLHGLGVGNLVLLGVGQGSRLGSLYLKEDAGARGDRGMTLVWVDARLQPAEQADLKKLLGDPPYPRILDVYDGSSLSAQAAAQQRLRSARRLHLQDYNQMPLPMPLYGSGADDLLLQRLQSWLKVHAPGMVKTGRMPGKP